MKRTTTLFLATFLLMATNGFAAIFDLTTSGEMEVVTQTQGMNRQEVRTNVVDVTSFHPMLLTNSAFGGSTVAASAKQDTELVATTNTLTFSSTAMTDITATLSSNPTNDFFTGGTGLAIFTVDFTATEAVGFSLTGSVTVDTPGDFGSTDAQVCLDTPNTNVCFEAEDDAGDPRQVNISFSGTSEPGSFSLFLFALSTLSESQTVSHATWNVTFNVAPGPPPPPPPITNEVQVVGLEVVQAIQDWHNSVLLVAGKRTFVRAHFQTPGVGVEAVTGKLRGSIVGGFEFPESPLSPVNPIGLIVTTNDAGAVRNNMSATLNFELPQSWTTSGMVELELLPTNAVPPALKFVCDEPAEQAGIAGDCKVKVAFGNVPNLPVKFVSIKEVLPDGTTARVPTDADVQEVVQRTKAIFPVGNLNATFGTLAMSTNDASDCALINSKLAYYRLLDGCSSQLGCDRLYFGVVHFPPFRRGLADFLFPVACHCHFNSFGVLRHGAAHELGHVLGQPHAVHSSQPLTNGILKQGFCSEVASPFTPDFPFVFNVGGSMRPTLGPMQNGQDDIVFGLDTHSMRIVDPTTHFELMSYCPPNGSAFSWVSSFTYEQIRQQILPLSALAARPLIQAVPQSFLVVRGLVDTDKQTAEFFPFGQISSEMQPPSSPTGDYLLRLLDAQSNVVSEIAFEPSADTEFATSLGAFIIVVPSDPAIRQAVVLHNGNILATQAASPNAPTVQVVFPNGGESVNDDPVVLQWVANDLDGDALTFVVQYSPDGGATWETLAADWPLLNYAVEHSLLKGSSAGIIRVIASDGFNTATDDSDAIFGVGNNPPQVFITTPTANQQFFGDQPVVLEATAFDPEDGALTDTNLQWISSIDGALGTGEVIYTQASLLSEGTHLITVIATDSGSLTSTASVNIVVAALAPATLADLFVTKEVDSDSVALGDNVTYTITVENQGPSPATSVTLTDQLPANANVVSDIASQGNCSVVSNTVVCNLGTIPAGQSATATVVLQPTAEGILTNSTTAASSVADSIPANNSATALAFVGPPPPEPHDLAVVKLKAPKKINFSGTPVTGKFTVSIQNRSAHNEVISNMTVLANLVTVDVQSLSNCPSFFATLQPPKAAFPITLAPKKKLTLNFTGSFDCVNDPLASSKTSPHPDYRTIAHVDHTAIDGNADTHTADNDCPHNPLPGGVDPNPDGKIKDKGCGGKNPDKTLGADVLTDVIVK